MSDMTTDWARLADAVESRRGELGISQAEVAARGPLSKDRVQALESGKERNYRRATLMALERALGWEYGSVQAVLTGGRPTLAGHRDPSRGYTTEVGEGVQELHLPPGLQGDEAVDAAAAGEDDNTLVVRGTGDLGEIVITRTEDLPDDLSELWELLAFMAKRADARHAERRSGNGGDG